MINKFIVAYETVGKISYRLNSLFEEKIQQVLKSSCILVARMNTAMYSVREKNKRRKRKVEDSSCQGQNQRGKGRPLPSKVLKRFTCFLYSRPLKFFIQWASWKISSAPLAAAEDRHPDIIFKRTFFIARIYPLLGWGA